MLEEIEQYLIAQGVGTDANQRQDWGVRIAYLPDDDFATDRMITLYELPGPMPEGKWILRYPRLMVHVRGNRDYDYDTTRDKAEAIRNVLHNTTSEVDSDFVSILVTNSAPMFLGFDQKQRPHFEYNFEMIRHE